MTQPTERALVVMPFEDHPTSLFALAPIGMAALDAVNIAEDIIVQVYDDERNDVIMEIYQRLEFAGFVIPNSAHTNPI